MFIMMSVAILPVETVVGGPKVHIPKKTNKTWIRMRIRDYLNGLENTCIQIGMGKWDDVKYTLTNQSKDLLASTSYWVNTIIVLTAMRNQWNELMTLNNWVGSTDKSVLTDIDNWLIDIKERTLTKAQLKARATKADDLNEQIRALIESRDALMMGVIDDETESGDASN